MSTIRPDSAARLLRTGVSLASTPMAQVSASRRSRSKETGLFAPAEPRSPSCTPRIPKTERRGAEAHQTAFGIRISATADAESDRLEMSEEVTAIRVLRPRAPGLAAGPALWSDFSILPKQPDETH